MVFPSLNNNIKNAQLVTALKKDFSTLSQATQMIVADNGGSIKGLCADGDQDCLRELYGKYVKDIKSCNQGEYLGNCWHENSGKHAAYQLNGSVISDWDGFLTGGVSVNGGFMRFGMSSNNCSYNPWNALKIANACGSIVIDVNGYTPPNTIGRDIFFFVLLENRIIPLGTSLDNETCSTSSVGRACAGKVLTEGAINY